MWKDSPTAAVGFPSFQFELNKFKKFHYIIYLVMYNKNIVTPKSPIVIHHQFASCFIILFSFISKLLHEISEPFFAASVLHNYQSR
jgi:hypothetical protein